MKLKVTSLILICFAILLAVLLFADYAYYQGYFKLPFNSERIDNFNMYIKDTFFPPKEYLSENDDLIYLDTPNLEKINVCGLYFEGQAKSDWFFEGSFSIDLLNEDGELLQRVIASTEDDWMQEDVLLEFTAEIICEDDCPPVGHVVFNKENPSGNEELDDYLKVPVRFDTDCENDVKEIINLFWGNINIDPQLKHCEATYPYTRTVSIDEDPRDYALNLLLQGPSEKEQKRGCFSSIGSNTEINSLRIDDGIAYVDVSDDIIYERLSTCYKLMIVSQIENTLKQFHDIHEVVITIDGSEDHPLVNEK